MPCKDLTGQRFGKLVVKKITKERQSRSVIWACECDCGNQTKVTSRHLSAGKTVSCGCARFDAGLSSVKDLTGKQIGNFLVMGMVPRRKNKHIEWLCTCVCGKQCILKTGNLSSQHTKSCGCIRGQKAKTQAEMDGKRFAAITGNYWGHVRVAAKQRGLSFEITPRVAWDIWLKQQGCCALSGQTLVFAKNKKEEQTASLDRIDSSKGYVVGNIQWVHKVVNALKSNFTDAVFVHWCKLVAKHHEDK